MNCSRTIRQAAAAACLALNVAAWFVSCGAAVLVILPAFPERASSDCELTLDLPERIARIKRTAAPLVPADYTGGALLEKPSDTPVYRREQRDRRQQARER